MKLNRINPKQVTPTALATAFARLNDGGGLALLPNYKSKPETAGGPVVPSGQHRWVFRSTVNGAVFEMGFGTLAEVTLSAARERATEARQKVGRGEDPRSERKTARADEAQALEDARRVAAGLPIENSVKDWVLRYVDKQRSSWACAKTEKDWLGKPEQIAARNYGGKMGKYVFPAIGDKNIREVTRGDITDLLTASQTEAAAHKAGTNGTETMHRLRKKVAAVFDFAMHSEYINRNVCEGQEKVIPKKRGRNFPAVKTAEALRDVLVHFDNYGGGIVVKTAMQVQAYLFQRSNITVGMQWAHIDLPRGVWTVPGADMKASLEDKDTADDHVIYLPRQVVTLLQALRAVTGAGVYVFPHEDDAARPMPVASLNDAMQSAMGKRKGTAWESYQVAHGFRALGISFGQRYCGLDKPVLDILAGHKIGDTLGTAYERNQWLEERQPTMQAYADWLEALRAGDGDALLTHGERIRARAARAQAANAPTVDPAQWARFVAFQQAEALQQGRQAA